jgi:hypothetical protein
LIHMSHDIDVLLRMQRECHRAIFDLTGGFGTYEYCVLYFIHTNIKCQ